MKRVIVCGGRKYADRARLFAEMDRLAEVHGPLIVIQGGATGADALAREWARQRRAEIVTMPAEWEKHGPSAGPIRNQRMVDFCHPDGVVAFPGGRGTRDMLRRAQRAGLPILAYVR
jgi:predicted Rossmann-fold nucleotide-binding protein